MHFILFGASGRTGKLVVTEVLARGHTATALLRDPSRLQAQPGLTIVTGSPLSADDVGKTVTAASGQTPSAAIITLNAVRKSESPFAAPLSPPRFLADSCATICKALDQAGISRIVVMSTVGVGSSWKPMPMIIKAMLGWTNVKYALEDHNLVDQELRQTKLDWTLVRAVRLEFEQKEGSNPEIKTLGSDGVGMGMTDSVTTASVAKFLVKVATEGLYVKEAVVVKN